MKIGHLFTSEQLPGLKDGDRACAFQVIYRCNFRVTYAFDLMYLDGHDLRGVTLVERKVASLYRGSLGG